VYIKEVIDLEKELAKLAKEQRAVDQATERTRGKLANKAFVDKAPPEVVQRERERLEELQRRSGRIRTYLADLQE